MADLRFNDEAFTMESLLFDDREVRFRAFEHRIYCADPVDPDHQELSIYVPEDYYEKGTIGKFDIHTAPIFMPNTIGGYRPGYFQKPGLDHHGRITASAIALYLGYVVVVPTARGIGLKDERGINTGVVPAALVDLKAAIRYLRHNRDVIPGDTEKIVTNGTSAGGAMSALLGCTGNHSDYEPYLREIGAADERDDVFASSCYCPITDLDHADMAYEWEFRKQPDAHTMRLSVNQEAAKENGITEEMLASLFHNGHPDFSKLPEEMRRAIVQRVPVTETMDLRQKHLSRDLAAMYPSYINSLNLKDDLGYALQMNPDGSGSFRNWIEKQVVRSMEKAVLEDADLKQYKWIDFHNDRPIGIDWDSFISFRTRMKPVPAFDKTGEPGSPENMAFGSLRIDNRHFTSFGAMHDVSGWPKAPAENVKLYNPLYYITDPRSVKAENFRIRAGAADRDTSLAVSSVLTLMLRNNGVKVDYLIPWGVPHAGDYDTGELFLWLHNLVK